MNDEFKQRMSEWLRRPHSIRGVLVRGIRFRDETFVCDFDSRDFPVGALEQAWRVVSDTFQVLSAQKVAATRLTWAYEKSVLHCVRRDDEAILGVFVSRNQSAEETAAVNVLLEEFKTLSFT